MKKILHILVNMYKNPRSIITYLNAIGLFNILSDKKIIKLIWWAKTGKIINLNNPKTFNEKIQWIKLNCRRKKMTMMVDKYRVREYIKKVIGEGYLVPLINVWDNPKEIDFELLPDKFVLKCNHNAAVGLCICRNKDELDKNIVIKNLKKGIRKNFYYSSREWAYKNVKRKIICEKYLEDDSKGGLRDYKVFCFNKCAKFIYISEGLENHETASISFYDLNGVELPFHRSDYNPFCKNVSIPDNFKEMITISEKIASDIDLPFVRVDLYSIKNNIYFSEITFYPNSGYIPFVPKEWDLEIGSWLNIN